MTASRFYASYAQGTLDPETESVLEQIFQPELTPLCELTPEQARDVFLLPSWLGTPPPGVALQESQTDAIMLHILTPPAEKPLPVLVFIHGGGFVLGRIHEFDPFCKFLATKVPCIVVSVDYRLAPEHKFPAAVEDAMKGVLWTAANAERLGGDASRIAVAGDSAGGNLATVVARMCRDRGSPRLAHQLLICPWVDLSSTDTESYRMFGDGPWLSTAGICWYRDHYLESLEQARNPDVSPLLAGDLRGLAPATIVAAEFDVLRDEGDAYAAKLKESQVPVTCIRYAGVLHDFATLPGLFSRANDAIEAMAAALRVAFAL
ncbi:MAG: alpha/beta hydrolase [Acidobacteriota bacterium]